jgi:class 3 adenylate cyclase
MGLMGVVRRNIAVKMFVAIGVVVTCVLLVQAEQNARREERALRAETRATARAVARAVVGAVENAMLLGDGIKVRQLIAAVKRRVSGADIHIYDPMGVEVFGPPAPIPGPESLSEPLASVLLQPKRVVAPAAGVFRPVSHEPRCDRCHGTNRGLRGVLHLQFSGLPCAARRNQALAALVAHGFVHIMTARRQDLLDEYFRELSARSLAIVSVDVYDREGDVAYGAGEAPVLDQDLRSALNPDADYSRSAIPVGEHVVELMRLPTEPRCTECHHDGAPVRGALAVRLAPASEQGCVPEEFEQVIETSLRYIMLSGLGRILATFLDAAVSTGALTRVTLFDHAGRVFWDTSHPAVPAHVAEGLRSRRATAAFIGTGAGEQVRVVEPLVNERACERCHGNDLPLRGVVTVALSTGAAATMRAETVRRGTYYAAAALVAVLVLLVILLRRLVVVPVRRISQVADAIGAGRLDVQVERASRDGDEMARLGERINAMVVGLRTKLQLEKFVSRGAAQAAARAGLRGVSRQGERRMATVLFSDIRGFTSFSERVPAEQVVAMLNRLMHAQAEVVDRHGGDIDKFVGDEVMAVFQGDQAAARAVQCGLAMVGAVSSAGLEGLSVGVGVSRGEVVYGAIGHEQRLDFTVIGDVVNVGARLCGAAGAGQVLCTDAVRQAVAAECPELGFAELEPMALKGKAQPLRVWLASSSD